MTKEQMEQEIGDSIVVDGVHIFTIPIKCAGVLCVDADEKYIFISSKLSQKHREELIKEGLKKHREGFKGEKMKMPHSEIRYLVAEIV